MEYTYILKPCKISTSLCREYLPEREVRQPFTHATKYGLKTFFSLFLCVRTFIISCRKQMGKSTLLINSLSKFQIFCYLYVITSHGRCHAK